jgi:hypothetical protein
MLARYGKRPATDDAVNRALRFADGKDSGQTFKPLKHCRQELLRAELIGATTCKAAGTTAHGYAPVLTLCRELLAAGLNPDQALEVYRGTTLALRVRSLRDGAVLTVKTAGNGSPVFSPLDGAAASPMRQNGGGHA